MPPPATSHPAPASPAHAGAMPSGALSWDQVRELRPVLKARPSELLLMSSPGYRPDSTPSSLPPRQAALLRRFVEEQRRVRANLLTAAGAALKLLFKASLHREGVPLGEEVPEAAAVVIVLDRCLRHGLRHRRNLWGVRRLYFDMVQEVAGRLAPQAVSTITSVHEMTDLRPGERCVAWIQMALMGKHVADDLKVIVEDAELIKQWYEPYAFCASEHATVLLGLFVGISTLNFSFYIKPAGANGDTLAPPAPMDDDDWPLFEGFAAKHSDDPTASREALLTLLLGSKYDAASSAAAASDKELPMPPSSPDRAAPPPDMSSSTSERSADTPTPSIDTNTSELSRRLTSVLSQNTYLEELQRDLQSKLAAKAAAAAEAVSAMNDLRKQLAEVTERATASEDRRLRTELELTRVKATFAHQLSVAKEDAENERHQVQQSRQELGALQHSEMAARRQLEALLDQERILRAEAESRESLLLLKQKEAALAQDDERCEHNREKATLAQQVKDSLARLEDVQAAKDKAVEDLTKVKIARKIVLEEKKQLEQAVARLEAQLAASTDQAAAMRGEQARLDRLLRERDAELQALSGSVGALNQQLASVTAERDAARAGLAEAHAQIELVRSQVVELAAMRQQAAQTAKHMDVLKAEIAERDQTILDLASELGKSKLRVDSLADFKRSLKRTSWIDDREATNCFQCDTAFSLLVRRHHCRHCGRVFCDACSSQRMALPSSAVPERVCDSCAQILLGQHSAD